MIEGSSKVMNKFCKIQENSLRKIERSQKASSANVNSNKRSFHLGSRSILQRNLKLTDFCCIKSKLLPERVLRSIDHGIPIRTSNNEIRKSSRYGVQNCEFEKWVTKYDILADWTKVLSELSIGQLWRKSALIV